MKIKKAPQQLLRIPEGWQILLNSVENDAKNQRSRKDALVRRKKQKRGTVQTYNQEISEAEVGPYRWQA